MSWDEFAEPVRDAAWSGCVTIESCGQTADLCFHLLDKDGNRGPNRPWVQQVLGQVSVLCERGRLTQLTLLTMKYPFTLLMTEKKRRD